MKQAIEKALAPLVGLPLWALGRAGSLEWLQFGRPQIIPGRSGESREVGAYALHLDCAWRLLGPDGMIWASDESERGHLPAVTAAPVECEAVLADDTGGFQLKVKGGVRLLVRPEDTAAEEYWRLLQPGQDAPHSVVGAAGIEPREA